MILKYKDYVGTVVYMQQIKGAMYKMILEDSNNVKIDITCDIHELELLDCIGNSYLTDKLFARRERKYYERYEDNRARPNKI